MHQYMYISMIFQITDPYFLSCALILPAHFFVADPHTIAKLWAGATLLLICVKLMRGRDIVSAAFTITKYYSQKFPDIAK